MPKILVIEDDCVFRNVLCAWLESNEFEVRSSENGRIGVELAQQYQPDLIICDILMPEMNGYEVLNQLRENPLTANIPFIFLSGNIRHVPPPPVAESTATYLTKPAQFAELLKVIMAQIQNQTME